VKQAINAALPSYLQIDDFKFKTSFSGQLETCCENGIQGLKASAQASVGVEVKAKLGFIPPSVDLGTVTIDGLGDAQLSASFFGGVEITLTGNVGVTYQTDCNFENPKLCLQGGVGLEFLPSLQLKGEAKVDVGGVEYSGSIGGAVGVTMGGKISLS